MAVQPLPLSALNAPINTIPRGLLGLLQLKELGRNPGLLGREVTPNLELFGFYAQHLSTPLVASGTDVLNLPTATPGLFTFATTVPQGVMWWVQFATIAGNLLAAETITNFGLVLKPAGNATATDNHLVSPLYSDVITARARAFRVTGMNFFAPPGATFAAQVGDDLTAATIPLNLQIRGFPIQV